MSRRRRRRRLFILVPGWPLEDVPPHILERQAGALIATPLHSITNAHMLIESLS